MSSCMNVDNSFSPDNKKPLIDKDGRFLINDIDTLAQHFKHSFVDGQLVSRPVYDSSKETSHSSDEHLIPLYKPHTAEIYGNIPSLDGIDIEYVCNQSKAAFFNWKNTTPQTRADILNHVADVLNKNVDTIAALEVFDTGKTINETRGDVIGSVECLKYFSAQCHNLHGTHDRISDSSYVYTVKEPLGVCLGIGAWNFPIMNILWKVAPALAAGNTMIYKPSELTPLTSSLIAYLFDFCGLPKNVLNVVQGDGKTGSLLCSNPNIAKVSFTGGFLTGKIITSLCSEYSKRVTLELGGKSPLIIFDDADIESAVNGAMMANYYTQGQVCSNASRIYVQENIYENFKEKLIEASKKIVVGDPNDEKTHFGAIISKQHLLKIKEMVETAKTQGATVLFESNDFKNLNKSNENGYFMGPVILENCDDSSLIVKNEIFGPVITLLKFSTEEEVISRSNNTPYGLAAGVFSQNIGRITRICSMFDASTIYANCYNVYPPMMAFGGRKSSGHGRENGSTAIDYYTDLKSVYVETGSLSSPFNL